jgi:predicted lysophospholipase L1 biosynthesis ABC-type transport system permease subunit
LQNSAALVLAILGVLLIFVYVQWYGIITNRMVKIPKTFANLESLRILFRPGSLYIVTFPLITTLFIILASSLQIGWQTYERVRPGEIGPNFFALNLLRQDIAPLRQMGYSGMIYEVVRARIDSINQQPLRDFLGEKRDDREFTREFNIATSLPNMPPPERGTVTVDEEFSKRLGIALGDTLEFSFLGKIRSAKIVAIRPSQLTEGVQPFFYFAIHPDFFGKQTPKNYFLADRVADPKELSRKLYALSARIISLDARDIQATII